MKRKPDFSQAVHHLVQEEASRICSLYQLSFDLEVEEPRSEEGYFKMNVRIRDARAPFEDPPLELVRSLLGTVEANIEERYQGLRIMLQPRVRKRPSVKHRKAG